MASGTIWIPVAPSFKGFGASIVKEAAGASQQAANRLDSDLGRAGKRAGDAAGKGMAAGVKVGAAEIEKATRQVVTARKSEADAAASVTLAEARLADARSKGANAQTIARNEQALESARRRQESAAGQLKSAEGDLDAVRKGEPGRAQAVIRSSSQLETARLKVADANDKVKLAEQELERVQGKSSSTATQVATAQAKLQRAKSDQASATDILRGKEALHEATLEDVEKQAKQTGDAVEDAGKKADKSGGLMSKAAKGAKNLALGLGAAAATGIGVALTKGMSRINQIDQATAKLTGLGHSAQNVEQIMNSASDAVKGTAFGLGDAATVAAATVAAGVKPGQDLTRTLKLVGDTATIAGRDMSEMGSIVNKVATSDMMQMDVANQLMDAGIPILQMVASEMGVTAEEARKMASDGKVSFETFQNALESGLGGAALESGNTLQGALANLGAAAGRLGEAALKPFIQDGKDLIGMLTEWVNTMTEQVGPAVERLADWLVNSFIPALQDTARWVIDNKDMLTTIAVALTTGVAAWMAYQKALIAVAAAQKLHAAATLFADKGMKGLNATMRANLIGIIVTAVIALIAGLTWFFTQTETGKRVWESFMGVLGKGVQFFKDIIDFGKMIIDILFKGDFNGAPFGLEEDSGIVNFLFGMRDAAITVKDAIVSAWTNAIQPVFSAIGTVLKWVGAIFSAIFLGVILVGWNLLKAAFSVGWALIQPLLNALGTLFSWIGDVAGQVFAWVRENWQLVVSVVFGPLGAIIAVAITHWDTLKVVIQTVWNAISTAVQWAWQNIVMPVFNALMAALRVVGSVFQWVWSSVIRPAWNALGAGIAFVWNSVIRPTWNNLKAALGAVGAFFRTTWNSVIKPVWDALGAGIRAVYDSVIQPAFDALQTGLERVGSFFSSVVEGIRSVWDQLKGHVARPINFVIETVWNNGLVRAWDVIAGFLPGLPSADGARLSPVAFAEGGPVPFVSGSKRGKDSVNALLMPDEHVWDVANVARAGGHGEVYKMRGMVDAGIPFTWIDGRAVPAGHGLEPKRFAEGGAVDDSPGAGIRLDPTPGEGGLQNIAKLAKRLIHRIWPSITTIGGYRQDAYPEHPSGRALDVMVGVGNPIGDEVTSWALANDAVLPLIHALWKQTVWMPGGATQPMGDRGNPTQNHMDHPHLWYHPKSIDPNVIPDGLVGHDGLSAADRMGVLRDKVQEILDKALDPIKEAMGAAIGTPPPEWLGIPPVALDETKTAAVDTAFDFIENLGDKLRSAYDLAKDVTSFMATTVTGLFRDNGGYIPTGQSVVTNETGKPEAVFNWKQVDRIASILNSVRDMDHLWEVMREFGNLATTGQFTEGFRNATGVEKDDELVDSILNLREAVLEGLDTLNTDMTKVLQDAGLKAATGFGSDLADMFGFKGVYDAINSVVNRPAQSAASASTSATPMTTMTTSGGVPMAGDPNVRFENSEVALETRMPDFDGGGGTPGSGPVVDQVKEAFAAHGWDSGPEWEATDWIVGRESGWDPNAQNPTSTAYGLFQFLDTTWAETGIAKSDNPKVQAEAGARYIKKRYGTPTKAKAFWEANNWYDRGGVARGIGFMAKNTLRPERVLAPSETEAFEDWLSAGASNEMLQVLHGIPSQAEFDALIDRVTSDNESARPAYMNSGPLVNIERLEARDEEEAMAAAAREARRVARSVGLGGGF